MTRFAFFAAAFLALLLVARAADPGAYAPPVPAKEVSASKFDWHDAKRNRDVFVKIYAPQNGIGPFPVIIFSHGLGGSREGYEYLGRHWAGCGYVSVHLQHVGSDDAVWRDAAPAERAKVMQKSGANLANSINRPLDVQFALDQLERLNGDAGFPLHGRLDLKRVGMSGHSFGGYTTLAVAGQTFAMSKLAEPRVKAAIQMSAPAFKLRTDLDKAYGSITIPVMHMTGTKDFVPLFPETTAEDRRIPFDHMKNAETCFVNFTDGDHMIFSGRGAVVRPEQREPDEKFQRLICAGTTAFWDAYLKENSAAKAWLLEGGYAKRLGKDGVFEKKSPAKPAK
ncbi:MAG: hypothetical protein HY301_10165 [Verrucomicrobia bacterium]|nr:hypothetical protein [Verrucomicrobiota bacterium]